jgi:hypothetical protein
MRGKKILAAQLRFDQLLLLSVSVSDCVSGAVWRALSL